MTDLSLEFITLCYELLQYFVETSQRVVTQCWVGFGLTPALTVSRVKA